MKRAKITALGCYAPPKLLTNADLEKMVDTSDTWIRERTGIIERHIVEKGVATSDLAYEASKKVLEQRGLRPTDIEVIIVATVTPDTFFPSTACLLQNKLGATGAWGFDLSAACSGFLFALATGAQFIANGTHKKVLVVGADVMSSIIDYQDRATCVIFGDAAGAVLLEPAEPDDGEIGILDFLHEIDGSGGCYLQMPAGGSRLPSSVETVQRKLHYVHQDGPQVFKYAVRKMYEVSQAILARNSLTAADIDILIPHQANRRIIQATAERMGLGSDKVLINIDRYGNTTAATIPMATNDAIQQGKLKKGSLALYAAAGAGYTVGAVLVRWAY
ncbi:MAG: 3-oxoacyl-ACP synthase [Acidobacteria bacterium RIFCSPLOWO2_12_FULL_60_22]|nr:MAG: 3-oxoacyl-ACP synthase [Acidobacteria bacterium RIFCSPLOWO2_12_FULL_60_22]